MTEWITTPTTTTVIETNMDMSVPEPQRPQPAPADIPSPTATPAMSSDGREDRAPVFREAYHAQLREVHGDNMRRMEALGEGGEVTGWRRKRPWDQETLNSLMEDVIRDLAAEGELVTTEKVRGRWWSGFARTSCEGPPPLQCLLFILVRSVFLL